MQKFTAVCAVGISALRRQGVGVIGWIQTRLGSMDLSKLASVKDQDDFCKRLDSRTDELVRDHMVKWGAARKAVNLFLRDCLYNKYLTAEYGLDRLEQWLEIPLDSVIAGELKKDAGHGRLPVWNGLKTLKKEESKKLQDHASQMAAKKNTDRIHLDVGMWVNNRKPASRGDVP